MWEQCYVEPGVRPAADRLAHGLRHAALGPAAVVHDRDRRGALADQSARHQGGRRRRHHRGAGGDRQRDRRCAARLRRARHHDAGDALQRSGRRSRTPRGAPNQGGRNAGWAHQAARPRVGAWAASSAALHAQPSAEADQDHRAICARRIGGRHRAHRRQRARRAPRPADRGREQGRRRRRARRADAGEVSSRRRHPRRRGDRRAGHQPEPAGRPRSICCASLRAVAKLIEIPIVLVANPEHRPERRSGS